MSEMQLKKMAKDLLDQADQDVIPKQRLGDWLDNYFVGELKRAEMEHAEVDPTLFEGLRRVAQSDLAPLYEEYREQRERILTRRQNRRLWQYVLGTLGILELLEAGLTRGRSLLPQLLIPTAIFYSFIGFLLYGASQYLDDLQLRRARHRFQAALERLDRRVQTDSEYDNRRQLMQADVLAAETVEILVHYTRPEDFWRDYLKVRQADPSTESAVDALQVPGFAKFLKFHAKGAYSAMARQHRFNRLFLEAQEIFVSRDRDHYVPQHLKNFTPPQP
jgi:hypothetical protein